jgi:hypothetical protein
MIIFFKGYTTLACSVRSATPVTSARFTIKLLLFQKILYIFDFVNSLNSYKKVKNNLFF